MMPKHVISKYLDDSSLFLRKLIEYVNIAAAGRPFVNNKNASGPSTRVHELIYRQLGQSRPKIIKIKSIPTYMQI